MRERGNRDDYDIVVAGGGMIGSVLALALAPLGVRIAVVEAVSRGAAVQPSFDDRSTALSRSSRRMFEALDLWPDVAAASAPIRRIHVSDRGRFGFSRIDAEDEGVEALGYVVINRVLGEVLGRALEAAGNVDFLCPARITGVDTAGDAARVSVALGDGECSLSARLLVAADGAGSEVRDMLGIAATVRDYGQCAVIGNVAVDRPLDGIAYERFTEGGPLALLPVAGGRAAFVRTVPADDSERVMALDDDGFLAELQRLFGGRAGRFSRVGRRASYPLRLNKASRLVGSRGVLVGNAAHGLHPVAAQGFNLGLRDVAALADCIADARDGAPDADPGSDALLERYAEWRRRDQARLVDITDGLVHLFGDSTGPMRLLRDVGMLGFDVVPGVKRMFARSMMGLTGRLPRLSRGVPLK